MKRSTIVDVAQLAGVSIKTVSRVLNRESKVRQTTFDRVERAMKELHYQPNSSGRRLATNRTFLIGLVYDNTNASSSYINKVQDGALEACNEDHYDLLIHPCRHKDPSLLEQLGNLVTAPRVDGLLLTPPISDRPDVQALMQKVDVPNVVISRQSVTDTDWTVCTDDQNICAQMVKHLFDLGHERIAYIKGHPDHRAMLNRYMGYQDGMSNSGLDVLASLVVQGDLTFESGVECGKELLNLKPRPTAVFCANDHMAAGVIKVAHEMGLSIPGDVSVAGFDDVPLAAQIWPQLTTIRQPVVRMSHLAGSLLIERLRGATSSDVNRIVNAELVIRESTGVVP